MRDNFRKLIILFLALLTLTLAGCESLDYREAVALYNDQEYAKAAELFAALGDYEDSPQLLLRSRYWMGIKSMELGDYRTALERFQALEDFEDSAQRVTECRYQLAIQAMENADYTGAEELFRALGDYRQTQEYLRQLSWQKVYDWVLAEGEESGSCYVISCRQEDRTVSLLVDLSAPSQLLMRADWSKDMGYTFSDTLTLALTRENTEAAFTAESTFAMTMKGNQIGSSQKATGAIALAQCGPDAVLTPDSFQMTTTDNLGKTSTSQNPADNLMQKAMAENLAAILNTVPQLLEESGLGITLDQLGFPALN